MKSHQRRDRILTCAARLFARGRFDEVLMEDIARAAGALPCAHDGPTRPEPLLISFPLMAGG